MWCGGCAGQEEEGDLEAAINAQIARNAAAGADEDGEDFEDNGARPAFYSPASLLCCACGRPGWGSAALWCLLGGQR